MAGRAGSDARAGSQETPLTAPAVDDLVEELETTLQQIESCEGGMVKLRNAEITLVETMKRAARLMRRSLRESTGTDRGLIISLFGGDCLRIARIRQVIEDARFTSSIGGEETKQDCLEACLSVEKVLNDIGWSVAQALARAKKAVANHAVAELQAQLAEELVQANAVLTELGEEPICPMSVELTEMAERRKEGDITDIDEIVETPAANVSAEIVKIESLKLMPEEPAEPAAVAKPAYALPEAAPVMPEPEPPAEPATYLVSNVELKATTRGLAYRQTTEFDESSKTGQLAKWGYSVTGIDEGYGWLRVGDTYLPMMVDGCTVLIKVDKPTSTTPPAYSLPEPPLPSASTQPPPAPVPAPPPPEPAAPAPPVQPPAAAEPASTPEPAKPVPTSPEETKKKAFQAIQSGELKETSMKVFKRINVQMAGQITWNSRAIPYFIKGVFKALNLPAPSEHQMYAMYTRFDANGTWSLDAEQCNSLIELLTCECFNIEASGYRQSITSKIEVGEVAASAEKAFRYYTGSDEGRLDWNAGTVRSFILDVFQELKLVAPQEAQMFAMCKRFDVNGDMQLDIYEARRLVETLCRSLYQAKAADSATSCKNGHVMTLQIANTKKIRCDVCGTIKTGSNIMWACRPCDYDMCVSCSKKMRTQGKTAASTETASQKGVVLAVPTFRALSIPPRQAALFYIRDQEGKPVMQAEISMKLWELPIVVLRSVQSSDQIVASMKSSLEEDGRRSALAYNAEDKLIAHIAEERSQASTYTLTNTSTGAKLSFSGDFANFKTSVQTEKGKSIAKTLLKKQKFASNVEEYYSVIIASDVDYGPILYGLLFINHMEASKRKVKPEEIQKARVVSLDRDITAAASQVSARRKPAASGGFMQMCGPSVGQMCSGAAVKRGST
mmetsp:Transcript_98142/g.179824  ORF Transcript_98142/g.179824 Transcript_98142/m.179824 type:complete len:899 (+) Transcript_98142:62-2758(+)